MNVTERRLWNLLRTLGVRMVAQAAIGPWTVDFLFPDLKVVVEADSRLYHGNPERMRKGALRDRDLQARGYLVVHVWSEGLRTEDGPGKILRHIRWRVYRKRGVRLGGMGARWQFAPLRRA
jgi:very-short-patch-repair endonuclease